jgi:Spy/CpxP family protein refolding chaperone
MFSVLTSLLPGCVFFLLGIGQSLRFADTGNPEIAGLEFTPEQLKEMLESNRKSIDEFEFSPEQIEQIKAIERHYAYSINQFDADVESHEILFAQLLINSGSVEDLKQKEQEMTTIRIEAAQVLFEKFLAIREVLTPEQLLKHCETFTLTNEQCIAKFASENPDLEQ